ncbi:glycosyltransferase family 2 protein [Jiella mangrovi]|uniref:glycosyltransferase family 2 protein n=1 Tax=Jiella mangrovi TaxID=2821407 RepID=UPI0031595F14
MKSAERTLTPDGVVLLCVERNAAKLLPSFLSHYRALGIARFGFVDDGSDDGSLEFLKAQDDVDVFLSSADFRRSAGGLIWRDMLLRHYGRGRWYVSVDSDEYLIYPGFENRSLINFIADLEARNLKRCHAPMIDIYPDGPIGSVSSDVTQMPYDTSPLFDGAGYEIAEEHLGTAVRGGPRRRLFGTDMRLSKFPLLYGDRWTRFSGGTHHGPLPLWRNHAPVTALLLHHKYPAGAVEDFKSVIDRGMHAGGAKFYKAIVGSEDFGPETDFRHAGSIRFEGSMDLVQRGFMQDIRSV